MRKLIIIVTFLFLLMAGSAWGATYYVSQSGAETCVGDYSLSTFEAGGSPFDDLAGDTVTLCGTFTDRVDVPVSGSSSVNVVTINGDSGVPAVLNEGFDTNNKSYVTLSGANLTINDSNGTAIRIESSSTFITLDGINVGGGNVETMHGIAVRGDDTVIKNCTLIAQGAHGQCDGIRIESSATRTEIYNTKISGYGHNQVGAEWESGTLWMYYNEITAGTNAKGRGMSLKGGPAYISQNYFHHIRKGALRFGSGQYGAYAYNNVFEYVYNPCLAAGGSGESECEVGCDTEDCEETQSGTNDMPNSGGIILVKYDDQGEAYAPDNAVLRNNTMRQIQEHGVMVGAWTDGAQGTLIEGNVFLDCGMANASTDWDAVEDVGYYAIGSGQDGYDYSVAFWYDDGAGAGLEHTGSKLNTNIFWPSTKGRTVDVSSGKTGASTWTVPTDGGVDAEDPTNINAEDEDWLSATGNRRVDPSLDTTDLFPDSASDPTVDKLAYLAGPAGCKANHCYDDGLDPSVTDLSDFIATVATIKHSNFFEAGNEATPVDIGAFIFKSTGVIPPVDPPDGTYDMMWSGEYVDDSDKAWINSGASSVDGTIDPDAAIHGDYKRTGNYGIYIGNNVSWPVPLDSSDWGFCKDIYMTATTGNTQLWENYKDADDFIVARIGDDGKVYLRQQSGAGGGAITAFTTALYAVSDTTWTTVCFRGSVAENKLGIKIGANDWEDDDDETAVTAFDTGEASVWVVGELYANYGAADDFWVDNIWNYGTYSFTDATTTPTFDSVSGAATTYSTAQIIPLTSTNNVSATVEEGGTPSFIVETGAPDAVCSYQYKNPANALQMYWGCELTAGMRTLDLDFSSASIELNGTTITNSNDGVTNATLTLPASIDNTTVIAVPGSWNIPNDYATYADLLTAVGYLIGDDAIRVLSNADITITDEDGTSGHPIMIYLREGYSGVLDLNHNDYYTIYASVSANIINTDGTDVNILYYFGGASAVSNSGGAAMGAGGNRAAIGR